MPCVRNPPTIVILSDVIESDLLAKYYTTERETSGRTHKFWCRREEVLCVGETYSIMAYFFPPPSTSNMLGNPNSSHPLLQIQQYLSALTVNPICRCMARHGETSALSMTD